MQALLLAAVLLTAPAFAVQCRMNHTAYPPPESTALPWHTLNLDLPPQERWAHIVAPFGKQMIALVDQMLKQLPKWATTVIEKFLDDHGESALNKMPQEFADEIRGVANASGIPVGYATVFNLAYELTGVGCTSFVAEDQAGGIWHARNLDFGLFSGWDKANETWPLTEMLRPLIFNLRVEKGGKFFANQTSFAGFIGMLTGNNGKFSITVDSRFDDDLDSVLLEWALGDFKGLELTQMTRYAFENETYDQAVQYMTDTTIIGPAYLIVGGTEKGQGAVISREPRKALDVMKLADKEAQGSFYVLETNYDNWKAPPFYDDRRLPAEKCLNETGAAGVNKANLFDILSGKPNLNLLTTHTTIMQLSSGLFEGYLQDCKWPCPIF